MSSVPSFSSGTSDAMRFRGMLKVPSLVFDLELEDGGIGAAWHNDDGDWDEEEVVSEIERFVAPQSPTEVRLVADVKAAMQHAKEGQDVPRLAQILTALGYRVQVRTALGGGDGADCLRNLRHTFLTVSLPAAPMSAHQQAQQQQQRQFIVDPQFQDQFFIAKTTARYASILAAVPQVFVGPEEHLSLLVNFLCTEMSAAFKQLGAVLPPWRQAASMLSKWQPRKSLDQRVSPPALSAAAAGTQAAHQRPLLHQHHQRPHQQQQQPVQQQQQQGFHGLEGGLPWHPASKAAAAPRLSLGLGCGFPQPQMVGMMDGFPQPQMVGIMPAMPGSRSKPSWEPQRIYMGGNFVPVAPAPAS